MHLCLLLLFHSLMISWRQLSTWRYPSCQCFCSALGLRRCSCMYSTTKQAEPWCPDIHYYYYLILQLCKRLNISTLLASNVLLLIKLSFMSLTMTTPSLSSLRALTTLGCRRRVLRRLPWLLVRAMSVCLPRPLPCTPAATLLLSVQARPPERLCESYQWLMKWRIPFDALMLSTGRLPSGMAKQHAQIPSPPVQTYWYYGRWLPLQRSGARLRRRLAPFTSSRMRRTGMPTSN